MQTGARPSAAAGGANLALPAHSGRAAAAACPLHQRRARATPARRGAAPAAAAADAPRGGADAVQPPPADAQSATFDYLRHCQEEYGKPGLIEFSEGAGGLPKASLLHPSGARAELYLHGAAITSWRHSDGRELLHLREGNAFDGDQPISGGIQIAWPQYGAGPLPTHGFLQHLHWSVVETAWREPDAEAAAEAGEDITDWRPTISLYADTDEEWAEAWPHRFEALYTVCLAQPDPPEPSEAEQMQQEVEPYQPWVRRQKAAAAAAAAASSRKGAADDGAGKRGWHSAGAAAMTARPEEEAPPATPSELRCILQIHNSDDKPLTFTTGLRPHLATADLATHAKFVKTLGLRGKYTLDYAANPLEPRLAIEEGHNVTFGDMRQQDRLFVDAGARGDVLFCPGTPSHFHLQNKKGFSDVGVVHPAAVAPAEARRFVQLAAARAVRKITLQPGEVWMGEMALTAHNQYWDLPPWELDDPAGIPIPEQSPDQMPTLRARRAVMAEIAAVQGETVPQQ